MKYLYIIVCLSFLNSKVVSQENHSDAINAIVLCNTDILMVDSLYNGGINLEEVLSSSGYDGYYPESNSIWLKWRVLSSGSLGFTMYPYDELDDLDFVLYRLNASLEDVSNKEEIRVMISGSQMDADTFSEHRCLGSTGIRSESIDYSETPGCSDFSDNFLKEIDALEGENYLLFVNNYKSSKGFFIEFTGSSVFDHTLEQCRTSLDAEISQVNHLNITLSDPIPNPAIDQVYFNIYTPNYVEGHYEIYNANGNALARETLKLSSGENKISINLSRLQSGPHWVRFVLQDTILVSKFIRL